MSEDEAIARLAGKIYDAALDPSSWGAAITSIADHIGCVAGCLLTRNTVNGTGKVFYGAGDQPGYRRLYFEKYVRFDPISPALLTLGTGEIISNSSVTPRAEFVKTRFYEEWMAPQGWLDNVFITLDRSPTEIAAFAIARGKEDGWADAGVYERLRVLAPHLRRSVLISKTVGLKTAKEATLSDALDGIALSSLLVDAEGRIVHANAAASSMFADGDLWTAIGAGQQMIAPELSNAIKQAIRAEKAGDARGSICVPLTSANGRRYVVHGLLLTSGSRRQAGAAHRAVAALFIKNTEIDGAGAHDLIAKRFELTPAELRVLLSIIETGDVGETAALLAVADSTIKTHLRSLFAKTGTSRQLELAKLVAGFSSAVSR